MYLLFPRLFLFGCLCYSFVILYKPHDLQYSLMVKINWKDIGLVIGSIGTLWGILISAYTVRSQSKKSKPKVTVRCSGGAPVYGGQLGDPVIFVEAQNIGEKAINLVSIELELPNKQMLALMDNTVSSGSGLPYTLAPEGNARYWFDMRGVARDLIKLGYRNSAQVKGHVRDAVGRTYNSKPYKVSDVSKWATGG